MANKKFELILNPIKATTYEKPSKKNELVEQKYYDKIDNACINGVKIGNQGTCYVQDNVFSDMFKCEKSEGQYIYDIIISDNEKISMGGENFATSSSVVAELDKRSQESRNPDIAAISRYSRDSLIQIGDSNEAESVRRKFDGYANKQLPKLRNQRQQEVDEITGEQLKPGYEFHHKNKKSIITDPIKLIDSDEGINVNKETHKEIHRKKIIDENQLQEYKKEIKNQLKNKK